MEKADSVTRMWRIDCREDKCLKAISARVSWQGEFFLSCRTAGKLLGVNHVTAARYLFLLAHDGIVEAVEKSDRTRRRATRIDTSPNKNPRQI
jgi:DNA-binding transcriptional regulator YhcF (GntR family)